MPTSKFLKAPAYKFQLTCTWTNFRFAKIFSSQLLQLQVYTVLIHAHISHIYGLPFVTFTGPYSGHDLVIHHGNHYGANQYIYLDVHAEKLGVGKANGVAYSFVQAQRCKGGFFFVGEEDSKQT